MKLSIPCLYIGYGRYISRFRAIPSERDCLQISERRLFLTFNDLAKSSNKLFKSLKVIGHAIGNYHPHGDISAYGTLAQLVENGSVHGEGNWGTDGLLGRESAASSRYTECKLKQWVYDLAFKYIKYVPEDNIEFEVEKLYLPCPIPIGLIGKDLITGISFHRTLIPRYKYSDLKKRLLWLLANQEIYFANRLTPETWTEDTVGPIIEPNIKKCKQVYTSTEMYRLLIEGKQGITTIPQCSINEKLREIHVTGLVPNSRQNHYLLTLCRPNEKTKKPAQFEYDILDISKKEYHIKITLNKKSNVKELCKQIYERYLKTTIAYHILVHDDGGNVVQKGVDELLLNSFTNWLRITLIQQIDKFDKLYETYVHNYIKQWISYIIKQYQTIISVDDIVLKFNELVLTNTINVVIPIETYDYDTNSFLPAQRHIVDKDIIDVCSGYNIKKLIEASIDSNSILVDIGKQKQNIFNNTQEKIDEFKSLKIEDI